MDYKDILDLMLDPDDVTVGGGCSSALAGAMAAGLMGMVAKLSLKKDFGLSSEQLDEYIEELENLRLALLNGTIADREGYLKIVNAYKLPKSTDEEKNQRKIAIEDAGVAAARAPMDASFNCNRVLEIGKILEGNTNPACNTDLQMGLMLAEIGLKGAIMNVEVNLPMIKSEKKLKEFEIFKEKFKKYLNN